METEIKINIIAQDLDEFKSIDRLLKTLPKRILKQIKTAQYDGVGLECEIRYGYIEDQRIILPKGVTQISNFGDYIGIYCGEFFFKLGEKFMKTKIEYIFQT